MKLDFQTLILTGLTSCFVLINSGCTYSLPKHAFMINEPVLKKRVIQTQRFENIEKKQLVSAIVGLMQGLNFKLDEGDNDLGLLVGSKRRSFIVYLPVTRYEMRYEPSSTIINGQIVNTSDWVRVPVTTYEPFVFIEETRMSIIIYPIFQNKNKSKTKKDFLVRANFQQMTWNESTGGVTQAGPFGDLAFYQDFFSKLSKSVFLETNL